MTCAKLSTCNCVCTAVQIAGLTYNSINYDTTTGFLEPETYPTLGCSCVLSAVVPMKRTGSGSPGIFDNLTIRVELHDNCIMYAEASLAVSGTPKWSGRCGSTLDCTSGRFSCGTPGLGGMINLQSWVEFGNSFNLVIDGDPCVLPCPEGECTECGYYTLVISGLTGDCACWNGTWALQGEKCIWSDEKYDCAGQDWWWYLTCEDGQWILWSESTSCGYTGPYFVVGDNTTGCPPDSASGTASGGDCCPGQTLNWTLTRD